MPDQGNYRNRTPYQPYNPAQQPDMPMGQPTPSSAPFTVTAAQPPPMQNQPPPTVTNPYYLAGYLQQYIGRFVRIEFSLGTSGALNDRIGILQEVGASYIVLAQYPSEDTIIGDLYSVKFVTVYQPQIGLTPPPMNP